MTKRKTCAQDIGLIQLLYWLKYTNDLMKSRSGLISEKKKNNPPPLWIAADSVHNLALELLCGIFELIMNICTYFKVIGVLFCSRLKVVFQPERS